MVNDPRVTTLLGRLGGLYRDPNRVDRDASSLLKSSVGIHLTPGIAPLVENNGDSFHCLVLQGTIAIVYRGNTYQLLVDIYLPAGYPIRPPISYVRLAENMYLKEKHDHVGSDGMVYLPYTNEWNARTHSLIEMVVAMSSVFSADPPVFTRAPAPPPPPAYSSYVTSASSSSSKNNNTNSDTYSQASSSAAAARTKPPHALRNGVNQDRYMQEQIAAIMAKEAEDANRASEIARRAEEDERRRGEQIAAQRKWEEKKLEQIKTDVNRKIKSYLISFSEDTKSALSADWRDQEYLKESREYMQKEIKELIERKKTLKEHIDTVDIKTEEIKNWLAESKKVTDEELEVDDICQPVNKLDAQMLDLSAESAALTDAMYFLDRGMYMGQLDCTTHLKMIRKLAKRQFLIRAHLIKINQVIAKRQQ